jgi:uncharacterized protein (TIGR00251 family)
MLPCLGYLNGSVVLQVVVQPRSSKTCIVGLQGEELKLKLTSPPVEGAANKLCCEFVAKLCGVAKSKVRLVSGDKSRHKRLLIEGLEISRVAEKISSSLKSTL